jgi:Protein of unknown function (DUF1302)
MSWKKESACAGTPGAVRARRRVCTVPAAGCLVMLATPAAHALQLYNGSESGNNLRISLDITTSYTGLLRWQKPSALLTSGITNTNGNDGDANLRHGIVGNTFEVLPVLDIKDGQFGMHFSGEYFVNTVYLGTNQNDQPAWTVNPIVNKPTDYASETRNANGHSGRLLDAFVYDGWNFGDGQEITLKAGQQTLFWGQSLFYGTNGIAGGQAPIDVIQAQNLVNPQSQQIFLPVGQIVATYQPNRVYTLQGYYQYQWEPYSLQGVGSYFSGSDVSGPGGYRVILAPGEVLGNIKALTPPSQNGQFGMSLQATYGNYDVGLFTERYDAKTPTAATVVNATPSGLTGTYQFIYPRDIWLYGTSLSTTIGAANVAGELSMRTHMPLVSQGPAAVLSDGQGSSYVGNANSDPHYPVGNTMTGLASFIYASPGIPLDPGGVTMLGEVEYVDVFRVTANKAALYPGRSSAAAAFDVEAIPAYYEVLPNLELSFPVSLSYNFAGNSQMDVSMNHGTGGYSFGVNATYHVNWIAALNWVGYFGKISTNGLDGNVSTSADRGYISLNLQHTF